MKDALQVVFAMLFLMLVLMIVLSVGDPKPKKQPYSCCGSDVCLTQHHHER